MWVIKHASMNWMSMFLWVIQQHEEDPQINFTCIEQLSDLSICNEAAQNSPIWPPYITPPFDPRSTGCCSSFLPTRLRILQLSRVTTRKMSTYRQHKIPIENIRSSLQNGTERLKEGFQLAPNHLIRPMSKIQFGVFIWAATSARDLLLSPSALLRDYVSPPGARVANLFAGTPFTAVHVGLGK